nr:MAG TPA: hypothetical protein [Caudoviricetes sp.]
MKPFHPMRAKHKKSANHKRLTNRKRLSHQNAQAVGEPQDSPTATKSCAPLRAMASVPSGSTRNYSC